MFKRHFFRAIEMCSIALVSLTISSFAMMPSPLKGVAGSGLSGQHMAWTGPAHISLGCPQGCLQGTYTFEKQDASNYYMNLS